MYLYYNPYRVAAFTFAFAFGTILLCAAPALAQKTGKIKGVWLQTVDEVKKEETRLNIISVMSSFGECALMQHFLASVEGEVLGNIAAGFAGQCQLSQDERSFSLKITQTGELIRCRSAVTDSRLTLSDCTLNGKTYPLRGDFTKISNF